MTANRLYAGPWVGEFGWELCWWNPFVRRAAKQFSHITVASFESSRYLYEFADEFVPIKGESIAFCEGKLLMPPPTISADKVLSPRSLFKSDRIARRILRPTRRRRWQDVPLDYRKFGIVKSPRIADVMCAFRPPKGAFGAGKEYPEQMCAILTEMLCDAGFSIACYGGKNNYCPPGAKDMRGAPLGEQCDALASALCAVGPSSGTIHLASLCGCPHVTWYTPDPVISQRRYELQWNPFNTLVTFLAGRPPEPAEIAGAVRQLVVQV